MLWGLEEQGAVALHTRHPLLDAEADSLAAAGAAGSHLLLLAATLSARLAACPAQPLLQQWLQRSALASEAAQALALLLEPGLARPAAAAFQLAAGALQAGPAVPAAALPRAAGPLSSLLAAVARGRGFGQQLELEQLQRLLP